MLLAIPTGTKGSYCMSTDDDCTNTGSYQHGARLSLYLKICCNTSNLGETVTVRRVGITQYILCPMILLQYCPRGIDLCLLSISLQLQYIL